MKKSCAFCAVGFALLFVIPRLAAQPAAAGSGVPATVSIFLKQEAVRLDSTFLLGISDRQEWEARRPELRREYLEMLGLWPLPERTPLRPQITGVIERQEGFRVEKVH